MPNGRLRCPIALGGAVLGSLLALHYAGARQGWAAPAAAETAESGVGLGQAAVLGIVQGLTEFLPISSTAHLKVVPVALGWGDPDITFSAVIQLGSIAAVVWYFWADLVRLAGATVAAVRSSDYRSSEFRLALGIAIGTVPIAIAGLLLKVLVADLEDSAFWGLTTIALASIVMGLLMGIGDWLGARQRSFERLSARDGIWVGLAQALAILPGVSRSGSTITAGLFLGLERPTAARFSFLLGIPAIALAGGVELADALAAPSTGAAFLPLLVGVVSSAIFSYLAIAGLIRYLQRQNTWVFVWYRLLLGGAILVAVAAGAWD
ncbi:MAG: undecaprenyl-diphosphatase [Cyanobacteria bacterium QS_8_64_29]|nr:MAG: undecaprenyl-diphosphatase [Cyanobacteria bacterium QS_8_64_29]